MITGNCHCGNIQIEIPHLPESVTRCNCSLCRRYASLWAYYPEQELQISVGEHGTHGYCWGDGYMNFQRCAHCGCVTHSLSTEKEPSGRIGVNFQIFALNVVSQLKIRHFDGAESWTFIEE